MVRRLHHRRARGQADAQKFQVVHEEVKKGCEVLQGRRCNRPRVDRAVKRKTCIIRRRRCCRRGPADSVVAGGARGARGRLGGGLRGERGGGGGCGGQRGGGGCRELLCEDGADLSSGAARGVGGRRQRSDAMGADSAGEQPC
jgi:hypothetical protein